METALNFGPFLTGIARRARGILLKRLVENADDDESAFTACRALGEILQQMHIAAFKRFMLEQLAEF